MTDQYIDEDQAYFDTSYYANQIGRCATDILGLNKEAENKAVGIITF